MVERHDAHGYWLEEAGPREAAPAARVGDARADVVVVGGGYTGLWTAWHVKQLEPEAEVVLLEADALRRGAERAATAASSTRCGSASRPCAGASATTAALAVARAAQDVGRPRSAASAREQGVDAWYRPAGYLQVSTAPAWDGAWEAAAAGLRASSASRRPAAGSTAAEVRAPLRLADLPRRRLLSRRRDRAAGAARPRPARAACASAGSRSSSAPRSRRRRADGGDGRRRVTERGRVRARRRGARHRRRARRPAGACAAG